MDTCKSQPLRSLRTDDGIYPSDDLPPYPTIFVTGHLVIPLFVWTDLTLEPRLWVEAAIWLPVTAIMCLVLLPFMKGAAIGLLLGHQPRAANSTT